MIGFKLSTKVAAFSAATLLALGLTVAAPQQAQAASKTGNFLLGAAAGAAGLALLHGATRPRPRGYYYQPRPVRRYYRPAPRRYYAPAYGPAPWSAAWYNYCASKYRSFNPNTGYYTTYSGYQKFCR